MRVLFLVSLYFFSCVSSPVRSKKSFALSNDSYKPRKENSIKCPATTNNQFKPIPKERLPKEMKKLLSEGYVFSNLMGTYESAQCDWKKCSVKMKNVTLDSAEKGQLKSEQLAALTIEVPNMPLNMSVAFLPKAKSLNYKTSYTPSGKSLNVIPKNIKRGKIKEEVQLLFSSVLFSKGKGLQVSPLSKAIMLKTKTDKIVCESKTGLAVITKGW